MKPTFYETQIKVSGDGVSSKITAGSLLAYRDALIYELNKVQEMLKEPYSSESTITVEQVEMATTIDKNEIMRIQKL